MVGLTCPQAKRDGEKSSGEKIGRIGVSDSERSKLVISIKKLFFSLFFPLIGITLNVESEVLAPFDLLRGLSSSNT